MQKGVIMGIKDKIKGGLIVSCQALENEPMHSAFIMGRFAKAAKEGGAAGIRANTVKDIAEIKKNVYLPIIGIIKREYRDSDVYITPTMKEVDELQSEGVDIMAVDATRRLRPDGETLENFIKRIRRKYPKILLMADTSDFEEMKTAEDIGFDFIGTTMRGYTEYTRGVSIPDFDLISKASSTLKTPVIAEGGIWEPWQLKKVFEAGAFSAVIGGAITRPQNITKRFVEAIKDYKL